MIKRVLVVSMVGLSLVGCVNNDTLSGDVYTASEAKQVQNVSYGTIVNVRQVQIQGGDDSNVIGAIGDRKSTRLNSSHITRSRMPSSA